jgi:hypothetical protein
VYAVSGLLATRSESVRPIFSVDGDGDAAIIEVLNDTPATSESDVYNSIESTTLTMEGCEESEICFGAVSYVTESTAFGDGF